MTTTKASNLDTNSQNFYLYSPYDANTWYFVPWDYDGAWGWYQQPDQQANARPRWTARVSNWWGAVLHKRFIQDPDNLEALVENVDELSGFFSPSRTRAMLDNYRPVITRFVDVRPDVIFLPLDLPDLGWKPEFEAEYQRLPGVVDENAALFLSTLERPMPIFMGVPEAQDEGTLFRWDASFDLQGDGLTYDFQVSRSPGFQRSDILAERLGLTDTELLIDLGLEPSEYLWRVTIRDDKDPENHWQTPFDSYQETTDQGIRRHEGMSGFTVE